MLRVRLTGSAGAGQSDKVQCLEDYGRLAMSLKGRWPGRWGSVRRTWAFVTVFAAAVALAGVPGGAFAPDPAVAARLFTLIGSESFHNEVHDVAAAPDGGFVYIGDDGNRVFRVGADGRHSRLGAGTRSPDGLAVAADGSVLVSGASEISGYPIVVRFKRDGSAFRVAGIERSEVSGPYVASEIGDGGPARRATLSSPEGVAALPDGGS